MARYSNQELSSDKTHLQTNILTFFKLQPPVDHCQPEQILFRSRFSFQSTRSHTWAYWKPKAFCVLWDSSLVCADRWQILLLTSQVLCERYSLSLSLHYFLLKPGWLMLTVFLAPFCVNFRDYFVWFQPIVHAPGDVTDITFFSIS